LRAICNLQSALCMASWPRATARATRPPPLRRQCVSERCSVYFLRRRSCVPSSFAAVASRPSCARSAGDVRTVADDCLEVLPRHAPQRIRTRCTLASAAAARARACARRTYLFKLSRYLAPCDHRMTWAGRGATLARDHLVQAAPPGPAVLICTAFRCRTRYAIPITPLPASICHRAGLRCASHAQ
jgi:hypothetical protein